MTEAAGEGFVDVEGFVKAGDDYGSGVTRGTSSLGESDQLWDPFQSLR